MARSLVMTVIGPDRPGLVEELSKTIAAHQGSWLESRMAQLAGHFAGILRVECPEDRSAALVASLDRIEGLAVQAIEERTGSSDERETLEFDVVGNDRPGIIRQLSSAVAGVGGNLEELNSNLESAPHAGHPLFRATGTVSVAAGFESSTLVQALESLGPDLSVSVTV